MLPDSEPRGCDDDDDDDDEGRSPQQSAQHLEEHYRDSPENKLYRTCSVMGNGSYQGWAGKQQTFEAHKPVHTLVACY